VTRPRSILVLGAATLRSSLVEQIERHPDLAATAAEPAATAITETRPDAVILDLDADPGLGGAVRAVFDGPILTLGTGAPADPLPGPSEHIGKPFRCAHLLDRLRAHLRAPSAAILAIGPFRLRPGANELEHEHGPVRLTEKEAAILARLAEADGDIVAKDILLRDIWGYHPSVATRTLETHVHRLRRKLVARASGADLLVTEKDGYRLRLATQDAED
jgi:DNA-binding winged helix-turn-helix (wHTH) protein